MPHSATDPSALLSTLRRDFDDGSLQPLARRIEWLRRLDEAIRRAEPRIEEALYRDLHKPAAEAYATEIGVVRAEIRNFVRHLGRWLRPRRVPTPLYVGFGRSRVVYAPKGVVLIVAPWNYPFQLTLLPLVGALAAGNCAVVKPSPRAPATARVVAELLGDLFGGHRVAVAEDTEGVMERLLDEPFDHIFYTGGGAFAHTILAAAARRLITVTLELGGKSPCIVGREADIPLAARRIVWGKLLGAGQTCVAPDYLLVHRTRLDELVTRMRQEINILYGTDPQQSPDYARMVSPEAAERIQRLLAASGGRILFGGTVDAADRYVAPTFVLAPEPQCGLMQEEIFGPVLPVYPFDDEEEIIPRLRSVARPLAIYYFGSHRAGRRFCRETRSGSFVRNDVVVQVGNVHLPFGGVGESGMGRYHGLRSLQCFSEERALYSGSRIDPSLRYPPYTPQRTGWLRRLVR